MPHAIPSLAGLCSMDEAQRPGLSVDECVRRLKRLHYAFKRLHEIFNARITAEPHVRAEVGVQSPRLPLCRARRGVPASRRRDARAAARARRGAASRPGALLRRDPRRARRPSLLAAGLYGRALPAVDAALERYAADTNPLADAPSRAGVPLRADRGGRHARVRRTRPRRDPGAGVRWRECLDAVPRPHPGGRRRPRWFEGADDGATRPPVLGGAVRLRPGAAQATSASPIRTTWPSTRRRSSTTRRSRPRRSC